MNYKPLLIKALEGAKANGKSRRVIAAKSGVTETTISNWLAKRSAPSVMLLTAVISACGYQLKITMSRGLKPMQFWKPADKKEAIRLYSKEFRTTGEIAEAFDCSRDHVERMLKAEGHLYES